MQDLQSLRTHTNCRFHRAVASVAASKRGEYGCLRQVTGVLGAGGGGTGAVLVMMLIAVVTVATVPTVPTAGSAVLESYRPLSDLALG